MLKVILICIFLVLLILVVGFVIVMLLLQMGLNNKYGDEDRLEMREVSKNKDVPMGKRIIWWIASYL